MRNECDDWLTPPAMGDGCRWIPGPCRHAGKSQNPTRYKSIGLNRGWAELVWISWGFEKDWSWPGLGVLVWRKSSKRILWCSDEDNKAIKKTPKTPSTCGCGLTIVVSTLTVGKLHKSWINAHVCVFLRASNAAQSTRAGTQKAKYFPSAKQTKTPDQWLLGNMCHSFKRLKNSIAFEHKRCFLQPCFH